MNDEELEQLSNWLVERTTVLAKGSSDLEATAQVIPEYAAEARRLRHQFERGIVD